MLFAPQVNEFDFACLNSAMYDLMDSLKVINKKLPRQQQLPDVLFLAITWSIYEWRRMMAKGSIRGDEDKNELLEWLEWWREKSGYNDLHFIKDRFDKHMTEEQKRVIVAFEAWGSEQQFFEWIAELQSQKE